jgi:renalase
MCGLMTALALIDHGPRILLVDKGRSVGGRMSTRRVGPGRADHGAQFFTVRTREFADYVEEWRLNEWVFEWATNWSDGSLHFKKSIGHARFAAYGGMNTLTKHIARELTSAGTETRLGERVTSLVPNDGHWIVSTDRGATFSAGQVVSTVPVPQFRALLESSGVTLPTPATDALSRITYAPSLCLLLWVEGDVYLPEPGARQVRDGIISWIADNQRKGISPDARVLTVHANPEFSAGHYEADDATVKYLLMAELEPLLSGVVVHEIQVKRWRYALPTDSHPDRYLFTQSPARLYVGGDAFGASRVEGAALSGLAIAAALRAGV